MNTFEGRILAWTAKAILFWGNYWGGPLWMPKSQVTIEEDDESYIVKTTPWYSGVKKIEEFTEYNEEEIQVRSEQ